MSYDHAGGSSMVSRFYRLPYTIQVLHLVHRRLFADSIQVTFFSRRQQRATDTMTDKRKTGLAPT